MSTSHHSVTYLTDPIVTFEAQYKEVRNKENRWLNDDDVKQLPNYQGEAHLASEWKKRAWMLNKLETYVSLGSFENVLDIGCGNGWMTHKIAGYCHGSTVGVDVGAEELEQAARCFGSENLSFACCSDWSLLPQAHFDLIYFAGSFHYFNLGASFWEALFALLKPGGEIHILETQFYPAEDLEGAKQRSKDYFSSLNTFVDYYNHFTWDVLPEGYDILYKPGLLNKFFKNRSPFPWIRMRK